MPTFKRTHEECRKATCLVCSGKATPNLVLTEELIQRFRQYAKNHNYDRDRDFLSFGICNTCKTKLLSQDKSYFMALPVFDYEGLANAVRYHRGVVTRSKLASGAAAETECPCPICVVGHSNDKKIKSPFLGPGKAPGRPVATTVGIDASVGPPARPPPPRPPLPRPPARPPPPLPSRPGPSTGKLFSISTCHTSCTSYLYS